MGLDIETRKKLYMNYPNVINESKEDQLKLIDRMIVYSEGELHRWLGFRKFVEEYG